MAYILLYYKYLSIMFYFYHYHYYFLKKSKLAFWMFLRSHLEHKTWESYLSLKLPSPIPLAYPLVQQLQERPQIQRTEVNVNHVLIYFEEVRFSVTLLDLGEP